MIRLLFSILLAALLLSTPAPARQDIDDVVIKPKRTQPKPRLIPRGPKTAQVANKGVLFVLTDPPTARVIIKDARGVVLTQQDNRGGEFRAELAKGSYEVEVASDGFEAYRERVEIRPPGLETVKADLTPTTGSIVIAGIQQEAKVLLNGKRPETMSIRLKMKREENQLELEGVPNGFYKIHVEQAGSLPIDRDRLEVRGGSTTLFSPAFREARSELQVVSDAGVTVYIDNEQVGVTNSEGRLRYSNVGVGRHEVRLERESYENHKDVRQFEVGKLVLIEHKLSPVATSVEFTEDFSIASKKWVAPASGWALKAGRMEIANAQQIGYVSGLSYRDFVMTFHLKLVNAGGAAWAVRVKDSNNYYLFYLSGPEGLIPNRFFSYIVRDGKFDARDPFSVVPVVQVLAPGAEYSIMITATGNRIQHKIIPSATGAEEMLGNFDDPRGSFPIGSIGFRTVLREVFSIDEVTVQPTRR